MARKRPKGLKLKESLSSLALNAREDEVRAAVMASLDAAKNSQD